MIPKKCKPLPDPSWKKSLKFGIEPKADKKPKPIPKISEKKKQRLKNGDSEVDLFKKIWSERPHSCENCGKSIKEMKPHNFDHIIPKSRGEEYRLDSENIQIVCFGCHFEKTTGLKYKGIDLD